MRALVIMLNLLFGAALIIALLNTASVGQNTLDQLVIGMSVFGLGFGNYIAYKKVNTGPRQ